MSIAKGWEWEKAKQSPWLKPSEDSYFLSWKWQEKKYKTILDLGSGLGRHSILFAKAGFQVSALDISDYGINHLNEWAKLENLIIDTKKGDMHKLPYEDNSFDCLFIYHAISHTDTEGMKTIMKEVERVLKAGGELYTSMCSKSSMEYKSSNSTVLDKNTIVRNEEGPEKDVPHFYVDIEDIIELFSNFQVEKVRHIDYCYMNDKKQNSKYYYINAIRNKSK
jgi:ubiquinone/menaquinone biosynthesis C-methylase UbiE